MMMISLPFFTVCTPLLNGIYEGEPPSYTGSPTYTLRLPAVHEIQVCLLFMQPRTLLYIDGVSVSQVLVRYVAMTMLSHFDHLLLI